MAQLKVSTGTILSLWKMKHSADIRADILRRKSIMNTQKQNSVPTLDVGLFDPLTDSIDIEGIRYSGSLFRALGCGSFSESIGQVLRIESRADGVVTLTRLESPP